MALTKEDVASALRTCVDPEIPVNLVDPGLIHEVDPTGTSRDEREVSVKMKLPSPGCTISQAISAAVHPRLLELSGAIKARANLVWEILWWPEMITPEGRKHLNLA